MTISALNDIGFALACILSLGGLSVAAIVFGVRWLMRCGRAK